MACSRSDLMPNLELVKCCVAGVAAFTGLVTSKLYGHQLHQAQKRYGVLEQDHEQLQAQLAQLEAQLNDSDARRWVAVCWCGCFGVDCVYHRG